MHLMIVSKNSIECSPDGNLQQTAVFNFFFCCVQLDAFLRSSSHATSFWRVSGFCCHSKVLFMKLVFVPKTTKF